jgi:hypothetical protein
MQVKKAVTLRVQFYIEGEDEPAHDFTETGEAVLKQVIAGGFEAFHGPYTIQLLKMELIEGGDEDSNDEDDVDAAQHGPPILQYTPSAAPSGPAPSGQTPPAQSPSGQMPPSQAPRAQHPLQQPPSR